VPSAAWSHASWIWADETQRSKLSATSRPRSEGSSQSLAAGTGSDTAPPEWRDRHIYFRKTFVLTDVPRTATLKITAERLYQCWINGSFVGDGPALVHPHLKSYDEYSISQHLRSGMNVVAIHGYFDGHDTTMPITPPGLLCELEVAGSTIGTDGTWKTFRPRAWSRALVPFTDLVFQEHYSFGTDPDDWKDPDFDDRRWETASRLGSVGDSALPWSRPVGRQIPFLTREEIYPVAASSGEVVEWRGGGGEEDEEPAVRMSMEPVRPLRKARVDNVASLVSGNTEVPCTLLGSDLRESLDAFDGIHDPTIILDFGKLRNAYFAIDLEASELVSLDIAYGPDLIEERVMPYRSIRSRWADRLALTAGRHTWRTTQWRQFRFVQLTLRRSLSPVKVHVARAEAVRHSFRNETVFSCSDVELEKFWKAAARTEDLVATDIFMDNASRERRQYAGSYSVSAVESLHGDEPMIHHYLRQISAGQLDDGFIMDSSPGKASRRQTAAEAGFYHVLQIWDHWEQFGEREVLEEHFSHCLRHLAFWKKFTNAEGMLVSEKGHQLTDFYQFPWIDSAAIDRRGTNLVLNAFYCLNLRAVAAMAKVLGKPAAGLKQYAEAIGLLLKKDYWDEQVGLFSDTVVSGRRSALTSEHSQSIMLYADLASREQAQRMVMNWQRRPEQLPWADYAFLYYVVEGLAKYGYTAFALELLKERLNRGLRGGREQFGEMLAGMAARDNTFGDGQPDASWARGLWVTGPSRAYAQNTGTWPPAFLLRHVAGFQMRLGAEGIIRLAPSALLERINVEWCGHRLTWSVAGNDFNLDATLPVPTSVEVALPFPPSQIADLSLNGIPQTLPENRRLRMGGCQVLSLHCTLRDSAARGRDRTTGMPKSISCE